MYRYKPDILGVSEVRWNGSGQITTTDDRMFTHWTEDGFGKLWRREVSLISLLN
jgi:hypothetical protein